MQPEDKQCYLAKYNWISNSLKLDSIITERTYLDPGSVTTQKFKGFMTREVITRDALNNETKMEVTYAQDLESMTSCFAPPADTPELEAIKTMQESRMQDLPIETLYYKNGAIVKGELNIYNINDLTGSIVLREKKKLLLSAPLSAGFTKAEIVDGSFVYDDRYQTVEVFDKYGDKNNLEMKHVPDGLYVSYIYGYNNSLPIATIVHNLLPLTHKIAKRSFFHTSFEEAVPGLGSRVKFPMAKTGQWAYKGNCQLLLAHFNPGEYTLTYWESLDDGNTWNKVSSSISVSGNDPVVSINSTGHIDEVRIMPSGARMKTTTYQLNKGKSSETDENGLTIYYEYDDMGEISMVRDNNRNPISSQNK